MLFFDYYSDLENDWDVFIYLWVKKFYFDYY